VITGAQAVAKRRRNGGEERRWLELGTSVMGGARELEREGKKGW
jgi:hypothetical protein